MPLDKCITWQTNCMYYKEPGYSSNAGAVLLN